MSKADISPTPIRSRRAVLGGIAVAAALPIAGATIAATSTTEIPTPDGFERVLDHQGRTWLKADGMPDPAFALIAEKRAADVAHNNAIDGQGEFDGRGDFRSDAAIEAQDNSEAACHLANEVDWKLATIPPTTLAGVAAVLRFANLIEDEGGEWPHTDTIGPDGWHYKLRATMAAAIEGLVSAQVGKAAAS
jgi:hypothetical protein